MSLESSRTRLRVTLPQMKQTWEERDVEFFGRDTREPARLFAEKVLPAFR